MATKKQQQQQREGQRQLKKKLKLERKLDRKMRKFFRSQNNLFLTLERAGVRLDANLTQPELVRILTTHYEDTSKVFREETVRKANRAISEIGGTQIQSDDPMIIAALASFILFSVLDSSRKISATSNSDMTKAMDKAGGDAKAAHSKLKRRGVTRSATIAVTETQRAAEGTKQTTAEEIGRTVAIVAFLTQITKTWITRMDHRVRVIHAFAEFQEVPASDPFIVDDEFLMYPGDTSLGASAKNTVHCRCNSIQEFKILQ